MKYKFSNNKKAGFYWLEASQRVPKYRETHQPGGLRKDEYRGATGV
jgi:hypothetical protein